MFIFILVMFVATCISKSTPKGDMQEYINAEVLDANDIPLGTLEDFHKEFIYVRTSEGFLDMLKPNGMPFTEWHDKDKSPKNQDWLFYLASGTGGIYFIVPDGKILPERSTFVWGYAPNQRAGRDCIAKDAKPKNLPGDNSYTINFHRGIGDTGYHYYTTGFELSDSEDTYLKYTNGKLSSKVKGYQRSTVGCKTNEDIGYPPAIDGEFALEGPIKLRKADGTEIKVEDVL